MRLRAHFVFPAVLRFIEKLVRSLEEARGHLAFIDLSHSYARCNGKFIIIPLEYLRFYELPQFFGE